MEALKKIFLILFVLGAIFCIKTILYPSKPIEQPNLPEQSEIEQKEPEQTATEKTSKKETVTIYFIGQNSNKEDVYKIVKRTYNEESDGERLEYVINELLKGPTKMESAQGVYTEIPKGVKLLSVTKSNGKTYIDLSMDFEQGGGTDGLYKRLYQLIKTINKNTNEPVYLKIEGRQVDVIGGEGIMINQPLKPTSLDG